MNEAVARRSNSIPEARILIAVPDPDLSRAVQEFLRRPGFQIERCHDAKGVLRYAGQRSFDVVVLDLKMGGEAHVDLISFIRQRHPRTELILLFTPDLQDRALEGIRRGAYFYLPTSCAASDIALVVENALRTLAVRSKVAHFEQTFFEELVGNTPAMQRVVELITKVAPTDSTVLFLGESGTGKEVFANTLHRLSRRSEKPFIAINCAALPEALLESEMFGHVKGSFTGAEKDTRGLFKEADGGTIFLDEIGDMSLVTQAKLLRVLQNGEIRPVGASLTERVDVRVVAATNKDLAEAVSENRFREDLYFRLNVITVRIPPLRERMDALPVLVGHFLARYNAKFGKSLRGLDDEAAGLLRSYDFPGNVRELESIVEHAVILADTDLIRPRDLPEQAQRGQRRLAITHEQDNHIATLSKMEARHIEHVLSVCNGNQTLVARHLGISRSTLWRKMREYGIDQK